MHVIPRDERLKLDAHCDLLLSDALAALDDFNGTVDPKQWRALARSEQLTFYRAVAPSSHAAEPSNTSQTGGSALLRFLVTGYLTGSLAQVTTGLYSDTSRDLMTQQSVFLSSGESSNSNAPPPSVDPRTGNWSTFSGTVLSSNSKDIPPSQQQMGSSLIDATVLHAEQDHHRRKPFRFAGVKWYAWHSQDSSGDRDLLAYERSGATADGDGVSDNSLDSQEIMYHVVQSIERPPEMRLPPGMRHMKLSVCYLYREVCEDLVECFAVGEYPARGSAVSQRNEDAAVSERVLTVSKALAVYTAKRLSRLIEKNRKLPVILSKKSCLRCSARRTVFDPLHTCCICKKSVCQSCRQEKAIFKLHKDTNKPETEVFCKKCLTRSKLPNTRPVSVERVAQLRKESRASSLSGSSNNNRYSIASGGSAGSGDSGGGGGHRGSLVSSVSSSSLVSTAVPSSPVRQHQSPPRSSRLAARTKANSTPGMFNYDALIHHYEVEMPMLVRPRTRTRASTLPSPLENGNSHSNDDYCNKHTKVKVSTAKAVPEQPLTAITVDLLPGEDVAENLRKTQIGLPVILMDVKSLRETQLGVPVDIEPGRLSEPILNTTSRATFFGALASWEESGGVPRTSITTLSPQNSPARRSDLYLADGPSVADTGDDSSGVEKLYQTYLERREKLQTDAMDEQELCNSRLTLSREHQHQLHHQQTQFRLRKSDEVLPASSRLSTSHQSPISQYHIFAARQAERLTGSAGGAALDGRRHQQKQPHEALPTKHDFHMDLYTPF